MPPTPSRSHRKADATCFDLDQVREPFAKDATYHAIRRAIHSAISRDDMPATIDGYKSRHGDASGVGGNSELTAVESAAFRLVAGERGADIVHAKVEVIIANVRRMLDAKVAIENALRLIPTGIPDREVLEGNDATWCRSCLRINHHSPRWQIATKGGSGIYADCSWCVSFRKAHGIAPPEALLRMHADGRRITSADLARHLPKGAPKDPKATPFQWRDGSTTGATLNPPPSAA